MILLHSGYLKTMCSDIVSLLSSLIYNLVSCKQGHKKMRHKKKLK